MVNTEPFLGPNDHGDVSTTLSTLSIKMLYDTLFIDLNMITN